VADANAGTEDSSPRSATATEPVPGLVTVATRDA
jgi:hypothetical protein